MNAFMMARLSIVCLKLAGAEQAGGAERYAQGLNDALRSNGVQVTVVDWQRGNSCSLVARTWRFCSMLRASMAASKRTSDLVVIDSHFPLLALLASVSAPRGRLVSHFHGPWHREAALEGAAGLRVRLLKLIEIAAYRRSHAIVTVSRSFAILAAELVGMRADIRIVPPGITRRVSRSQEEARATLGVGSDVFLVGSVRRIIRRVGLIELVYAWANVAANSARKVQLLIVGEGPLKGELASLVSTLNLNEGVTLMGALSDDELATVYAACDVTVVPSLALEGFGLVVLESLATGTPVIASRVDGLQEALCDFSPQLLVEPGDPDALSDLLLAAAEGRLLLPASADAIAYSAHYDWETVAAKHINIYESAT